MISGCLIRTPNFSYSTNFIALGRGSTPNKKPYLARTVLVILCSNTWEYVSSFQWTYVLLCPHHDCAHVISWSHVNVSSCLFYYDNMWCYSHVEKHVSLFNITYVCSSYCLSDIECVFTFTNICRHVTKYLSSVLVVNLCIPVWLFSTVLVTVLLTFSLACLLHIYWVGNVFVWFSREH